MEDKSFLSLWFDYEYKLEGPIYSINTNHFLLYFVRQTGDGEYIYPSFFNAFIFMQIGH